MTVLKTLIFDAFRDAVKWRGRELACLSMLLASASCVPSYAFEPETVAQAAKAHAAAAAVAAPTPVAPPEPEPMLLAAVSPTAAAAINASIPLSGGPNPRAASIVFRGATPLDQQRSLQCLAEAIYYESRSESEDGQRAVAQVVLNRVRHPAYPGSVCGVVYQGPMRAGGGCQFTFTCDGSLASPPQGAGWLRARRIAAAALAGSVFAPVGHATHYHTHEVVPHWAYKLVKSAVIGSHNFYRMQDRWGTPQAFSSRYSGRETSPSAIMASRLPVSLPGAAPALAFVPTLPADTWVPPAPAPAPAAQKAAEPAPPVNDRLPVSNVRPEFENSGRWLSDAPQPSAPASR